MSQKRPNFLIIIADDLGFSDTSPYGSEINTPALNALAQEGLRMTNFHTASACSPTRSMLFSGTDNHIAGLGCMWEHMQMRKDYFKGQPGYEGYLNHRVAALPEILSDGGYFTVLSGKWHLGLTKEFAPCSRGVKKNFTFLPEWNDLSPDDKKRSAKTMEIYAAMVEQIDENIGRVVEYLKESDELDNTFILFMSDNGAEGAAMEALPIMGAQKNLGNKDSFIWYGPRWANAGTAPSRGVKGTTFEGGIRCPCIIRYPPLQPQPGSISNSFVTVMDILPTVLELAGLEHPGKTYRGREVALPRGKSWVPHLASKKADDVSIHGENTHTHGWELFGHRAIRQGNWKAVWDPKLENERWQLFNLEKDPSEQSDVADTNSEVLDKLVLFWDQYVAETGMIPSPSF
ncbi:hypothetical protein CEP52_004158 [Fusarium oligoseptatum]|uniref:Sulfatase N-terminal domain-containing protein n=1 Tax=Fusarium oligoseptatum TaxID=2604345 RepID=A0A428U4P5_9HYPO|nr:hypothetical protein CEP52_004158 [Fusarium oligoseptatum]